MLPPTGRRVTLFAGHYGSGKSTAALGYAGLLRERYPDEEIVLADLDIVNPYFRTSDCAGELEKLNVGLIVSEYAGTNVDVPAMPGGAYRITDDRSLRAIIDVGGDDRGALAMGRYAEALIAEGNYDMLAVINRSRPLTRTPEDTVSVLKEIEGACGIAFTGIVNCTNFGRDTDVRDIYDSLPYAEEVSRIMGIPVVFTSVLERLVPELPDCMPVLPVKHIISHGGISNF